MLELLILYSLSKQEQTLYALRKNISKHFGEISIPSHGALHPAVKRLENKKFLTVRTKLSDGGKKYTYYSVSKTFLEYFNNKFMEFNTSKAETLDSFLFWLKIHLITIDIVDKELIGDFREKCFYKLESYKNKAESKLNDEYIELTSIQKKLIELQIEEISNIKNILINL